MTGRFRTFHGVDDATLQQVHENEEEMLRLAFRYIRSQIEELREIY